jgi:hypothetical protein
VAALLYFATAGVLLWLCRRYVRALTLSAAIVLLLLPLVFTGRAVLTGKVYAPIELPFTTQPLADHRAEFHVPPPHNSALVDIAFQMIPWREAVRRSLANGEWPLWNRFSLCGDVLAGAMQPAAFSPFTLIACLLPAALSYTFTGAIAFFVAGLGAFLLARELAASEEASILAAIGWMFSAQLALTILWPVGFAWALAPFVLTATHRRSIGLLTVALVLLILAGHPETLLHIVVIAGAYGLFTFRRGIVRPICAGILALFITAIALLPFLDALHHSGEYKLRKTFAEQPYRPLAANVKAALIGDLFPFTRGGVHFPLERAEGGSILLAIGIVAVFFVRRREVAFFAALLVIAFMAGINAWPVAQLLHKLPLLSGAFNDRLAAAVPLSLSMLAAFAYDAWPRRRMAAVMGVLAVIVAIAAYQAPLDRTRIVAELVPLAIAAIALAPRRLVIVLLLLQRTMSDGSLIPVHPREMAYPRLALFDGIDTKTLSRIAPFGSALLPNTPTMYGLEDVRGNTPMTLAPLAEAFPMWVSRPDGWFLQVTDLTRPMLSMMNVRYSMLDVSAPIPLGWSDVKTDVYTRLIENEHVLSRAFVPGRIRVGRTPNEELSEMAVESDFARRAWLALPETRDERDNGTGRVTASISASGLDLKASMERAGFVVISQTALPGWRGYLDGRRVKLIGANHAFLAVYVPAGEHRVRLRYLPRSFIVGRNISFATLLLIAIVSLYRSARAARRLHRSRRDTSLPC